MEAVISIRLVPTGRVVGVTVLQSSGDIAFDRSVEQAAFKAEQFVELQEMDAGLFERRFRQVDVAFSPAGSATLNKRGESTIEPDKQNMYARCYSWCFPAAPWQ